MKKSILVLVLVVAFVTGAVLTPQYAAADHDADFLVLQNAFGILLNAVIDGFNAVATAFAALPLPDSVDSSHIINQAIQGFDIAPDTISGSNIASGAVTTLKIATDAVGEDEIQGNSVGSSELKAGAVDTTHIIDESITSQDIEDDTITSADINDLTITAADIQSGGVTQPKIAGDAVDTSKIIDGTIQFADIDDNGCLQDQIIQWDGIGWVCNSLVLQAVESTPIAVDTAGDVGRFTSIAIGTDGFPVISYHDGTNDDLKVVHCTNASCSTTDPPQALDTAGDVGEYTSIAIGTDGFPVISYYDGTNADLKVVHCTNASCSTFDTPQAVVTAGSVGSFTSLAIGTDEFPVISYNDASNTDLEVVHCTNTNCSTTDTPQILDTIGVFHSTSIAIGTDGFPVISYNDDILNLNLNVVHCTNTNCSTNDVPQVLDTGVLGSSLAIGTDGFPVISYEGLGNDLKMVHCTNVSCSTSDTPQVLDSTVNVGSPLSLAIGTDGFPVISYRDEQNGDLRVLHCTDAICFTKELQTDTAGDVGSFTSLAIGTDGFPVISYYDGTNADLKVLKQDTGFVIGIN